MRFIEKEYKQIDYRKELKDLVKELKLFYYKLLQTYQNYQIEELLYLIKDLEDLIESYSYL